MSGEAPQVSEPNPAWDRFAEGLKSARAPLSVPPSANEVARLLARADEAGARAPWWSGALLPAGAAALVAVGVIAFVTLREAPETSWVARPVMASGATTQGSITETVAAGRALFELGDDRVGLGPSSKVEILRAGSKATRLSLSAGSLAAHVDPSRGKRSFDVETPQGRVHVVGTIFRVETNTEGLTVEVQRGIVEVTVGGSTSKVTAGQRLRASASGQTLGSLDSTAFDELSEVAPAPVVEVVVPPPAPEEVVVAAPEDEPKKQPRQQPASGSKVSEWRSRAARGECGLVMPELKRHLVKSADDLAARMTLADCQRRSGSKREAVETYLKAANGRGADANRATLMAASLLHDELSEPSRALKLYERYLSKGPESRELEAGVMVRKARALESIGQKAQARATLDAVIKRFSDTPAAADALRLQAR